MDNKTQETKQADKKPPGTKNIRTLLLFVFLFFLAFYLLILFVGYSLELYYKEKDKEDLDAYNRPAAKVHIL